MKRITESSASSDPQRQVMKTSDEMLRLRACWCLKRITHLLGCSYHPLKDHVAAGGVVPSKSPERPKRLDRLEGGCARDSFGSAEIYRRPSYRLQRGSPRCTQIIS